ncbi:hypothetical protein U8P76_28850 (plasmid) [Rhizobium johnstonii]|nr:hypothetical protein U8P76_28850 [Rhizobium johnstonii]
MELTGESSRRHGLSGSWRTDEQELAPWYQTMAAQFVLLPLLEDDSLQPSLELSRKNHARQPDVGIANGNEVREVASRLREGNRSLLPPGRTFLVGTRCVDKFTKLHCEFAVASSGLIRGGLQRNRQELLVVAFNVALQERD